MRVEGRGLRVEGRGLRVEGSECRVQGSECRVQGSGFKIQSGDAAGHREEKAVSAMVPYRGTSLIINTPPVRPYSSPMPKDLW